MLAALAAQPYYKLDVREGQAREFFRAYVEDLDDYAVCDIEAAIRAYRRDPKAKAFPTSGQLRALASESLKERLHADKWRNGAEVASFESRNRPLMWWCIPRERWHSIWREEEIPEAYGPRNPKR